MPLKQDTILLKTLHLEETEAREGDALTSNATPDCTPEPSERGDKDNSPTKTNRRRRKKAKGLDPAEAMNQFIKQL